LSAILGRVELQLRHWREDDADALGRAVEESLDHLRPWMAWAANEPIPLPDRIALIRTWESDRLAGAGEVLGVWLGDRVAGGCGLHARIGEGGLEIGYWIHVALLRRGLATEVARQLCERAFADPAIDRVEIHHDLANAASGGVPAKLGFTHVSDTPRPPEAPAEEGVERIWRLTRRVYEGRRPAAT
jgi:RimJ/RimL family protein N-acetyltransferase